MEVPHPDDGPHDGPHDGPDKRPDGRPTDPAAIAPLTALPSVTARVLAFVAIAAAGACGGLIGWSFVGLQCDGSCSTPKSVGAVVGALIAALGVAVVSVLGLRAMGEWNRLKEQDRR